MWMIQRAVILTVFLLTPVSLTAAATAVLDRTFGADGRVSTEFGVSFEIRDFLVQPDGRILVLGRLGGPSASAVLVRYLPDGTLDPGFGTGGISRDILSSTFAGGLGLQSDGKIIVAGALVSGKTQTTDFSVARFNQNGTLDNSFGNGGITALDNLSSDWFTSVAVQTDDKIVAVGSSDNDLAPPGNVSFFASVRFNPNGTIDQGFGQQGLVLIDRGQPFMNQVFRQVRVLPGGRVVMVGNNVESPGSGYFWALLEANGTVVSSGSQSTGPVLAGGSGLAVLPDGKFLLVSTGGLRRFLSDGGSDAGFRSFSTSPFGPVTSGGSDIAVRSDGRFFVLNQRTTDSDYLVAYNADGREIGRVRGASGDRLAVQNDDKFLILDSTGNGIEISRYLSINSPATRIADFDRDERTDPAVVRSGRTVYVLRSSQDIAEFNLITNPGETVRAVPENFSRDDQFPLFYWRSAGANSPAFFNSVTENGMTNGFHWGLGGDVPVGGDYDGEIAASFATHSFLKTTEPAVFRPTTGEWWVYNPTSGTFFSVRWGIFGDRPVPADYDYDGITDPAVYRPSSGEWWILRSSDGGATAIKFGIASDIPLTGDFDGDGRADLTVYRPEEGNWYQLLSLEGFRVVRFGLPTDDPVPGDYDGDGRHDIAVFRQGVWYILQSGGGLNIFQWGTVGDTPVSIRYDR